MSFDGIIVVLSYPDTVVRPAHSEFSSKLWPKLGIGGENAIQAGHAAMLLIHKERTEINYFDFGRYITSYGSGRVRCKETDPELKVPITAKIKNDHLTNIKEILLWLDTNPEKTHGEGRLVASVNTKIDYSKAFAFVKKLIDRKEVPYGAFVKKGSNCARFVTDAILSSCGDKSIVVKLKTSNMLTPSPIGNAIKGTTEDDIYIVENQKIKHYNNRSVFKEYKRCFFKRIDKELNVIGTELPNKELFELDNATWLGGIGSGAWFKIEEAKGDNIYLIARYTVGGIKDFEGVFKVKDLFFDMMKSYKFIYPSNCQEVFIKQGNTQFKMVKINS